MGVRPNSNTRALTSSGEKAERVLIADQPIDTAAGLLTGVEWESFAVAYPTATQEVFTFYSDNAQTDLVATITINYTDSTKVDLLNGSVVKV